MAANATSTSQKREFKSPFSDLAELEIRKEALEKSLAEVQDRIGEQKLKLSRAQRDVTDFSGRLKYSGKGGLNASDVDDLRRKEEAAISSVKGAEESLNQVEADAKTANETLHAVKRQIDTLVNQLKMRYCNPAASNSTASENSTSKTSASPRSGRGDGGSPKEPIAASFGENLSKLVDEIKFLLVSGGKYPCLKLFVNDATPINDAAPHFTSWEQRTLAAIFNSKEKVMKTHQRMTEALNAIAAGYPELTKSVNLWTEFVEYTESAFLYALTENIERALLLYEKTLGGRSAPELFSVNLKLTSNFRVQVLPSAHDLPNQLISVVEEKLFTVVPSNAFSDLISVPTATKSGKGAPLKRVLASKTVSEKLESVRNHVARYGEELVAAVVKIEDRFQRLWHPDAVQTMSLEELRKSRDDVDFDFGFVRQRIFGGAFQLNAFPLQDTLSSLLTAQIDARRALQANTSDDTLRAMIHESLMKNAVTSAVPAGGLSQMLENSMATTKKQFEWSDRFEPQRFVEQLISTQLKSYQIQAAPVKRLQENGNASAVRSSVLSGSEARDSTTPRTSISTSKEVFTVASVAHSKTTAPAELSSPPSSTTRTALNGLSGNTTTKPLAPITSPRPNSTPSNGARASITQMAPSSLTPNRHPPGRQQVSPNDGQDSAAAPSIRSAELLKSSVLTSNSNSNGESSRGAWDSPTKSSEVDFKQIQPASKARDKPRTIDLPPREPDHAPSNAPLLSPYREKQVSSHPYAESSSTVLPQIQDERRPRSILKSGNTPPPATATGPTSSTPSQEDDEDERMLQRLLQKEKESLERIRQMREKDDQKRREIQAAHRRGVATDEALKKVSPRSEYQQLLEEQERLEQAKRENEIKLREAEKEARRIREEQELQRKRELAEEERQQAQWEEQLRRQHEDNAKRRAREKQQAEEAEREALRRKMDEEEKRRNYQKELEDRLEEELKRRAQQQQREREERDQERVKREHELHQAQEAERNRQRAVFDRLRASPQPRDNDTPTSGHNSSANPQPIATESELPPVSETSALRRKLSLPPVQPLAAVDSRPATPPSVPLPTSARSGRKPTSTPLQGMTPRGNMAPPMPNSLRSSATQLQTLTPDLPPTPRDRMSPVAVGSANTGNSPLAERSLLDEYKQYCLNFGIKPNSGLLKSLPSVVGDYATTINLDLNYIGVKGVQPLLQILKRNRGLKLLNLKDNNLENNEVRALVNVLLTESGNSLTHLDLSNNPISLAGGSAIMDLVSQKKSLTTVVLRGTLIQPKVVEKIVEAAESNRRRAAWNGGQDDISESA